MRKSSLMDPRWTPTRAGLTRRKRRTSGSWQRASLPGPRKISACSRAHANGTGGVPTMPLPRSSRQRRLRRCRFTRFFGGRKFEGRKLKSMACLAGQALLGILLEPRAASVEQLGDGEESDWKGREQDPEATRVHERGEAQGGKVQQSLAAAQIPVWECQGQGGPWMRFLSSEN